jgi:hypothetical protein
MATTGLTTAVMQRRAALQLRLAGSGALVPSFALLLAAYEAPLSCDDASAIAHSSTTLTQENE